MSVGTPQLAGREAELEIVEAMLEAIDGATSRTLGVLGEPGIGKSRLLGELARRASARGHLVLTGRASELESLAGTTRPQWGAADDAAGGVPRAVLSAFAGEIARLAPICAGARAGAQPSPATRSSSRAPRPRRRSPTRMRSKRSTDCSRGTSCVRRTIHSAAGL
jgi:AAA ATPase-like protein